MVTLPLNQETVIESTESSEFVHRYPVQWYLGVDLGTTGISATLLNRALLQRYPIYWLIHHKGNGIHRSQPPEMTFRLPCEVECQVTQGTEKKIGFLLNHWKPFLNLGIPYSTNPGNAPVLQWSEEGILSLADLRQGLRMLLSTLSCRCHPGQVSQGRLRVSEPYTCGAVGLNPNELKVALAGLEGVILGCSAQASDAYRFNLREAVLAAGLVEKAEQILIVEDAIATFLSCLPLASEGMTPTKVKPDGELLKVDSQPNSELGRWDCELMSGGTLILNVGATTTEMAVVELSEHLEELTQSCFTGHSLAYGGNGFTQDLMLQLLLPAIDSLPPEFVPLWERRSEWPEAGKPDLSRRYQVQQFLQSLPRGRLLWDMAEEMKRQLQTSDRATLTLPNQDVVLFDRDFERLVLTPFVQELNQELNHLLSQTGISSVAINHAFCAGGGSSWLSLSRWLRQKLPNAVLMQEASLNAAGTQMSNAHLSRVAWGLVALPFYPQVLDVSRHQYSDYFLLKELLDVFDEEPLSEAEVMQRLEQRGINTRSCQSRIQGMLKGRLPAGLVPSAEDWIWLHPQSQENPDYQGLKAGALFYQEVDRHYFLNLERGVQARQYLQRLAEDHQQTFDDPLPVIELGYSK